MSFRLTFFRSKGETALHDAAANNHVDMARLLLEHKADVNQQKGSVLLAEPLRAAQAAHRRFDHFTHFFRNNATALYVAAFANHLDMARLLLNFSADVNYQTK